MDPLIGASLINTGAGVLGGIGNWLGGSGDREELQRILAMMRKDMKTDPLDVNGVLAARRRAYLPKMNAFGRNLDRTFGLDAGMGAGELFHRMMGDDAGFVSDGLLENARMKTSRNAGYLTSMLNAYASRG